MNGETSLFLVHLNYQSDRLNTAYQTGLLGPGDRKRRVGGVFAGRCRDTGGDRTNDGNRCVGTERGSGVARRAFPHADVALEAEGRSLHFRQRAAMEGGHAMKKLMVGCSGSNADRVRRRVPLDVKPARRRNEGSGALEGSGSRVARAADGAGEGTRYAARRAAGACYGDHTDCRADARTKESRR